MIYDLYRVLTAKLWQVPQDANFESISEYVDMHSTYEYQGEIISERQFVPIVAMQLYEGMESELYSLLNSKLESFLYKKKYICKNKFNISVVKQY